MSLDKKVNFICDICNCDFRSEYQYTRHKNKKDPCIDEYEIYLNEEITNIKNKILIHDKCIDSNKKLCSYCKSEFSTKGTLKRHVITICTKRKNIYDKLEKYNDELDRITKLKNKNNNQIEIQDLSNIQNMDKDEIIKLVYNLTKNNSNQSQPININITNNNNSTNTQNTNNTTNNTNNTINNTQNNTLNLNNYDNPNCDFLTMEQKNKFLKDRYKGLIDFITFVYFNEAYPENHTILYTNLRSKFGHIYKNNKWFIEEIDMIADKLNGYSFDKLSGHLDTIKEDKDKAIKYEKVIDRGEKFVEHFSSNDSTKESRTNIKKLIYNNKDLIGKTKEKTVKNK
jgi:hypothetical protein